MEHFDIERNGELSLAEVLSDFEGEEDSGFQDQWEKAFKEGDADSNHLLTIEEIPKFTRLFEQTDEL